jgi:hypothetical protein
VQLDADAVRERLEQRAIRLGVDVARLLLAEAEERDELLVERSAGASEPARLRRRSRATSSVPPACSSSAGSAPAASKAGAMARPRATSGA